jgi:opacity protein-like surface antigen
MKTKGFALIMLVLVSMGCFAQEPEKRFGFELNTGASMATKKIGDAETNLGFGFEGTFQYRVVSNFGVYAGWGWNRFGAESSFAGDDVCFEETGYVFGLSYVKPIGSKNLSYYVKAGALYNHVETENSNGDIINDTGHGLGFQLAGGININLGSNWSLTPGLKFNTLSRDTDFEGTSRQLDYQYISARIGILKKF